MVSHSKIKLCLFKIFPLVLLSCFSSTSFAMYYEYAVMGDAGDWNSNTRYVYESLLRHNVKQIIMPGDNLYTTFLKPKTYEEVWAPWRLANFDFFAVAIGNHNAGYAKEIEYFNMPGEYYSIIYDHYITFIVLNSDNDETGQQQAYFLDSELKSSTTPFNFIIYHHPSYRVSPFHGASEKPKFQAAIRPILQKYRPKITALFVGHDHVSLVAHFNDLPVILSGSTKEQRPHIPLNYVQDGVLVTTPWFNAQAALWARLRLTDNDSAARIDFIRGYDDKNMCSVEIVTGQPATLFENCYVE